MCVVYYDLSAEIPVMDCQTVACRFSNVDVGGAVGNYALRNRDPTCHRSVSLCDGLAVQGSHYRCLTCISIAQKNGTNSIQRTLRDASQYLINSPIRLLDALRQDLYGNECNITFCRAFVVAVQPAVVPVTPCGEGRIE